MKQKIKATGIALTGLLALSINVHAQSQEETTTPKIYIFKHNETPNKIERFYTTAYTAGQHNVNTLRGNTIRQYKDTVMNFAVSPAGNTVILI